MESIDTSCKAGIIQDNKKPKKIISLTNYQIIILNLSITFLI